MNKRQVVIGKLKAAIDAAGAAHFIAPMRVQVAAEILRQLEDSGGGTDDSATRGAQPQSERILQQPALEQAQQDSGKNSYNGPRALAANGYKTG